MTDASAPARRVFVVIAAFNEEAVIETVIRRLQPLWPNIVVVDDGSTDNTANRAHACDVMLLRHAVNRGQGAALQTGIRFALLQGADIIVTFDADGQHSEQNIPALVDPIARGMCDVTLGSRFLGHAYRMPLTRRLLLKAAIWFTRITSGIRTTDVHNGLRGLSRAAAAALHITMDRMAHASEILEQIHADNWRVKEVPVDIYYSDYSLAKGQTFWSALAIGSQILMRKLSK